MSRSSVLICLLCSVLIGWSSVGLTPTAQAGAKEPTVTFHPLNEGQMPKGARMVVGKVQTPPKVDGNPHEATWKKVAMTHFVKADGTGKPKAGSWIKLCYDAKHLYVLFYALRPKGHRDHVPPGPTQRDKTSLFQGDALQVFLQPKGKGTRVYQIAMNPEGGIYDLAIVPDNGWMKRPKWNGKGIDVAGRPHKAGYFVEASIPFAALGVKSPQPGGFWRGNFCRNERSIKELSCWTPSSRVFFTPGRFGVIQFSGQGPTDDKAKKDKGHHIVSGRLMRSDGGPAAHVVVRAGNNRTRTDSRGKFKLKGVAGGKQILGLTSPRYKSRVGQIQVKAHHERIAPITLTAVNPYRPQFQGPIGSGPVAWLQTSIDQPVNMKAVKTPGEDARARQVTMWAAPGQYESRAVAFLANDKLTKPTVKVDWSGPAGQAMDKATTVHWVKRALDRQYYLPRETSVYTWKYLWNSAPTSVAAGEVRMLVATVHVPKSATAGKHEGTLTLHASGKKVASLPMRVRVADFHLVKPTKRLGLFYEFNFNDWTDTELADIHAHGGSLLVSSHIHVRLKAKHGKLSVDTSRVRQAVKQMQKHGFDPPYLVYVPMGAIEKIAKRGVLNEEGTKKLTGKPAMRRVAKAMVEGLKDVRANMHIDQPFVLWWMDEIFNKDRLPRWMKLARILGPLTDSPVFVTMNNRTGTGKDLATVDPYMDIRCYNGPVLDRWLAKKDNSWDKLAAELKAASDTGWTYYNDRGIEFSPEHERLATGYWLWRSPLMANVPWVYRRAKEGNSLLDTLDNARGDLGMAFHDPQQEHKLIRDFDWEAYRQGYNDLRYLATLKHAIDQAPASSNAAQTAKQWLKQLQDNAPHPPTVTALAKPLKAKDYVQRRRKMTRMIEALY